MKNDFDAYFEDTMRAGHYENRAESVEIMIHASRGIITHLLALGVRFEKKMRTEALPTHGRAHSKPRICFHKDITGEEITTTLLSHVQKLDNVTILEYTAMTDIIEENDTCVGIKAVSRTGNCWRFTRRIP